MNILDGLERLAGDSLYDVDRDSVGSFGYLTERGEMVEKALPALIRVARAAEQVDKALARSLTSEYRKGERQLHDVAWPKLVKALKQLRELGESHE